MLLGGDPCIGREFVRMPKSSRKICEIVDICIGAKICDYSQFARAGPKLITEADRELAVESGAKAVSRQVVRRVGSAFLGIDLRRL